MFDFLFRLNDIDLFVILSSIFVATSVLGVIIVGWMVPMKIRSQDETIICSVSSLISLLYGLLAGITALYLMNNINNADDATQHEANAAASIVRTSQWLLEPTRSEIQQDIRSYANTLINIEWPLLRQGKDINVEGDGNINKISNLLYSYNTTGNPSQILVVQELIDKVKLLFDARQDRIHVANSQLSVEIWFVIILGTVLTIGINFLYAMNRYLHIAMMAATSLMVTAMLFLLITLDRPFQGEFAIEPTGFIQILSMMDRQAISASHPPTPKLVQ